MKFGFVYVLKNENIKGLLKIGCTQKPPHQRALELSKQTACPSHFDVLFYAEFTDHYRAESLFHREFNDRRVIGSEYFDITFTEFYKFFIGCDLYSTFDLRDTDMMRMFSSVITFKGQEALLEEGRSNEL